jgi:hypothetical protein
LTRHYLWAAAVRRPAATSRTTSLVRENIVRLGINYRFDAAI